MTAAISFRHVPKIKHELFREYILKKFIAAYNAFANVIKTLNDSPFSM